MPRALWQSQPLGSAEPCRSIAAQIAFDKPAGLVGLSGGERAMTDFVAAISPERSRYRLAILTGIRSESKRWPSVTTDSPPERPDRMTISSAVDLLTSTGLTRATASSTT